MNVLGMVAKKLIVSHQSIATVSISLLAILAARSHSTDWAVTALEPQGPFEQKHSSVDRPNRNIQLEPLPDTNRTGSIPNKNNHYLAQEPSQSTNRVTPSTTIQGNVSSVDPVHITPAQKDRPNTRTQPNSISNMDGYVETSQPQIGEPTHTRTPEKSLPINQIDLRSFRINRSTLPTQAPDTAIATVQPGNLRTPLSPPSAIFVPHIYQQRARLLVRTMRNMPFDVRHGSNFYRSSPGLSLRRTIPKQTAALNRHIKRTASPKGKPTHGFTFISSLFGKRPNPFGRGIEFHNGIDKVGARGTPILSTASGRVISSRRGRGLGIHVIVDHGSGYQTLYAHLSKKRVKNNQWVERGQIIGYLGNTGRSTGPHLHYAVYLNRKAVDPKPYIFR